MNNFSFKKVDPSDTQIMEAIYRLRFEVYARQCNFIREEDYPLELESDEYDKDSVHFVAINSQGTVVGTARIILTHNQMSPLLKFFSHIFTQHNLVPGSVAEISRLMISKKLRPSPAKDNRLKPKNHSSRLSQYAAITNGLCREIYLEIKKQKITHWCALMEKGLLGLLRIYGFKMQCVGDDIDVYGPVRPYIGKVDDVEESLFVRHQIPSMMPN